MRKHFLNKNSLAFNKQFSVFGFNLTSSSNCCFDKGVQLLVTTDGELQVAGGDTFHLQVFGGIACQFQNLNNHTII